MSYEKACEMLHTHQQRSLHHEGDEDLDEDDLQDDQTEEDFDGEVTESEY